MLTTPLLRSFIAFQDETGISWKSLGHAMGRAAERNGAYPLFELEKGHMTEAEFLDLLATELELELGHHPELHGFREIYFKALDPNEPMVDLMRDLQRRGLRMALLTNNVREWEPLWRSLLPVDEIFELVVDSAFVGMRKPEREIYELTLERLGNPDPAECIFIDDVELHVDAARDLGIVGVHFRNNGQAVPEIEAALGDGPTP